MEFYAKANELGGLKAKMRLAAITQVPSAKAESEPDTPELIKSFESALEEIKKEL